MRLTLRTLLAYLDDTLEPQQAKEIGTKIAHSEFASTLTSRIKDVLRRRRITAPDVEGPGMGIDPNTVAEYLDNTLSPEAVAEIERIFLESDINLAEVAASHQILTLVLGEPVDIVPESRERMYALGYEPQPVETAESAKGNGKKEPPSKVPARPSAKPQPVGHASASTSFSESLPPYLRRKPLWKRAFPYVVVLVLFAAFLGAVFTDKSLFPWFGNGSDADTNQPNGEKLVQQDDGKSTKTTEPPVGPRLKKEPIDNSQQIAKVGPLPPLPKDFQSPPRKDVPENGTARKQPVAKKSVVGKTPPIPVPVPPNKKGSEVAKKPAGTKTKKKIAKKPAAAGPKLQYVLAGPIGLLWHADTARGGDWTALAPRSLVHAGDRLAAAAPFDSRVLVADNQYQVDLLAGTAVDILPPNTAALFGFDFHRGRLIIRPTDPEKAKADKAPGLRFALKIDGQLFRVDLLTPDTVCGIEVVRNSPDQFEQEMKGKEFTAKIFAAAGSVRVSDGEQNPVVIDAPPNMAGWVSLSPPAPKPKDAKKPAPKKPALVAKSAEIPLWLTKQGQTRSAAAGRFAALYLKEFDSGTDGKNPAKISMLDNVPAIVRDRRAYVSQYAVETLALTEKYEELVKALAVAAHEESRRAAINGLRTWIGQDPGNGKKLQDALKGVFTEDVAKIIYKLVWGFNEKDARDVGTSYELLSLMNHAHVAVRELAFLHVHRLTGRTYEYRPNLLPGQRAITLNRWRMHLEKQEGTLLPTPKPKEEN